MLKARVIPCLLLDGQQLVKTQQFKKPLYVGDPVNAVNIYNEKEVDELIVIDITASSKKLLPDFELIEKIASECFMPVAYGGGINSVATARRIFEAGIEKVVVNSAALENENLIPELAQAFGSQSIVAAMDVKKTLFGKNSVFDHKRGKKLKTSAVLRALELQKQGAGELFVYSVDRDGTFAGYDIELLTSITKAVNIPVIACGGGWELDDFDRAINQAGVGAAAAGSRFVFQNKNRAVLINFPKRSDIEKFI